jgi:hypothetical protein
VGRSPFYDPKTSAMYNNITEANFQFPGHVSKSFINLVSNFLRPRIDQRVGCMNGGASDIKVHEWNEGVQWERIYERALPAPIEPNVSGPDDSRFFDRYTEQPLVISHSNEFASQFDQF